MLPEAQASQSGVLPSIFLASTFKAEKKIRYLQAAVWQYSLAYISTSFNPRNILG